MSHTNFLGIPVEGDITRGEKRANQRPIEELEVLIEALLADPVIHDFGWSQYTPYFNDGDPCVFKANSFWVRTHFDAQPPTPLDPDWLLKSLNKLVQFIHEDFGVLSMEARQRLLDGVLALELEPPIREPEQDEEEPFSERFGVGYGHPTLGESKFTYVDGVRMARSYEGPDEQRFMRCYALSQAISSGHYDDVLLDKFGDHSLVQVTREKIVVDEYVHD